MEPFYDRLTGLGYDVWIDKDGIESGDAFKKTILRAIKASRCVVFFSSANSNASDWTAKEIGVAVKNKIPVIPVRFDDSDYNEDVQFDLINLDFTDYSKPEERDQQQEKFIRSIKKKLGERTPAPVAAPSVIPETPSGCELHFGTDLPCDIYQFKKKVGHIDPDGDFCLELRPGKYKFEFVNASSPEHRYSLLHTVEGIATDYIDIELKKNGVPPVKEEPKQVKATTPKTSSGQTKSKPSSADKKTTPSPVPAQRTTGNTRKVASSRDSGSVFPVKIGASSKTQPKASESHSVERGTAIVFLEKIGDDKQAVVSVICEKLGQDRKSASTLISLAPVNVASGISDDYAKAIGQALADVGATVKVFYSIGSRESLSPTDNALNASSFRDELIGNSSVLLKTYGWGRKGKVVKVLQDYFGYNKSYAQEMVESTPATVATGLSVTFAEEVCSSLNALGATATVTSTIQSGSSRKKYSVILHNPGNNLNKVIRILREYTELGKSAKEYCNLCPVNVLADNYNRAYRLYKDLTQAGATASMKEQ